MNPQSQKIMDHDYFTAKHLGERLVSAASKCGFDNGFSHSYLSSHLPLPLVFPCFCEAAGLN